MCSRLEVLWGHTVTITFRGLLGDKEQSYHILDTVSGYPDLVCVLEEGVMMTMMKMP